MKKLLSSVAALSLLASQTVAGTLEEPTVVAVQEVEEESSSAGWVLPLIALGAIALIVSQDDDDDLPQLSDIRLKRNIERIGAAENGLPLYRWQYLWSSKTYEGVMAQDVLAAFPEAVVRKWHGFYAVRYGKLGLQMKEVAA